MLFRSSSVTKNATGDYTVNFTNAIVDANYSAVAGVKKDSGTQANWTAMPMTYSASNLQVNIMPGGSNLLVDAAYVSVAIFR